VTSAEESSEGYGRLRLLFPNRVVDLPDLYASITPWLGWGVVFLGLIVLLWGTLDLEKRAALGVHQLTLPTLRQSYAGPASRMASTTETVTATARSANPRTSDARMSPRK
jgi:hypothetical protein